MAKETVTRLIDDLDGTNGAETISFALDGKSYEIDLSAKNARAFRKLLAPYCESGTPVRRSTATTRRKSTAARDFDPAEVRAWATKKGIALSARGRIPATVAEKYLAAHR